MRKSFASLLTAQKEPRPLYKGRGLIPVLPPFFPQGSHNCGSCSTASGAIRATAENKNCAPGCRSVSALRYCPAITVSFRYGLQEPSGPRRVFRSAIKLQDVFAISFPRASHQPAAFCAFPLRLLVPFHTFAICFSIRYVCIIDNSFCRVNNYLYFTSNRKV